MYDSAVEEIKKIFRDNCWILDRDMIPFKDNLDKDLSDFLKRYEEGLVKSNEEAIRENQEEYAREPMFDKNDLD